MENTSSIGDASSALSDLWLVYPVAGDCQRGGTDNRIDLGLWLRACGLSAGAELSHYLSARSGGNLVDGYLCIDGRCRVYWPGLADENGQSGSGRDGAHWCRVYLYCAGDGLCMGQTDVGHWWVWDARLTSELVLLFLYVGAIALWHAFDDRRLAGRAAGILVLIGVVNLPIIHYSVEWWNTLHQGSTRMQQSIDPAMRAPLRLAIVGYLLLFVTLALMRMRNLILMMEKRRPWVSELILKRGRQ